MAMTKWTPTTNLMMLRRMGKLLEELGELSAVAARCIIQGIDEIDPGTGKVNRRRLEDEIADVMAQCDVTIQALGLDISYIDNRCAEKEGNMREWEAMFPPVDADAEPQPRFVVHHMGMSYGVGPGNTTVLVGHILDNRPFHKGTKLYEEKS